MSSVEPVVYLLPPGRRPMFPAPGAMRPTDSGQVALGGDLAPETLVEAYAKGVFPWTGEEPIPWFSPDPRAVLVPGEFHASRSLRKRARSVGWRVTLDRDFPGVIEACATVERSGQRGTWITPSMLEAYTRLHRLGVAHSVEVWDGPRLVGGLYGVALGRAFFGESMFHRASDASKLALWRLCQALDGAGYHFVDCQQDTPHLRSLGATTLARERYLQRLFVAVGEREGWEHARRAHRDAQPRAIT